MCPKAETGLILYLQYKIYRFFAQTFFSEKEGCEIKFYIFLHLNKPKCLRKRVENLPVITAL
jgi:hypothetical protein